MLTPEQLATIRDRAQSRHGCTADRCGSTICQTQRDRAALLDHVDALTTERDELRENVDADQLMLAEVKAGGGNLYLKVHGGGPKTEAILLSIADSMRDMLDTHNAPNYLEMEIAGPDGKRYIMLLQRRGKITPHEARKAAEAERDALAATVERVRALADEWDMDYEPAGETLHAALNGDDQ